LYALQKLELLTLDEYVTAPSGLVYSTNPRTAEGPDGFKYFVKGPDPEIVFAELAGCLLAASVGLKVPSVAACTFEGETFCGTREVADLGRNAEPLLRARERVTNFNDIYSVIPVDVWLANTDRNMGNVLGRSLGKGNVEFVMIDFEKATALRANPTVSCPTVKPQKLWPTDELGRILRATKPLHPPGLVMQRIKEFVATKANVTDIIDSIAEACPLVNWAPNSSDVIVSRGIQIAKLVGEVWEL
jgi:hypothetical protein